MKAKQWCPLLVARAIEHKQKTSSGAKGRRISGMNYLILSGLPPKIITPPRQTQMRSYVVEGWVGATRGTFTLTEEKAIEYGLDIETMTGPEFIVLEVKEDAN